jgi:O-antigen/teichoic acid export membrane protein
MIEKNIAKATGAVSLGSLIVQVGGILGQFVYAIWLTPSDFGLWAAASAAMALIGAFVNAGEANAYLAGKAAGVREPFKRSKYFNYFLAILGILLAVGYGMYVDYHVAILIVILAFGIPLQGRGAMLISMFIKVHHRSRLISFQAIATIVRLLVGVIVASIWHSSLALAFAYVTYSLVLVLLGQMWLHRKVPHLLAAESNPAGSVTLRVDRAMHQFSQTLPNQIDYLTISILASAQTLGLYFFAYQATSAVSGMLSSPLSKAMTSELSTVEPRERVPIVARFLVLVVAAVTLTTAFASLMLQPLSELLGSRWQDVVNPLVILLASLPARFVIPVTEALYMVSSYWRRSSAINLADAFGISIAVVISLLVLDGDIIVLVSFVTFWKVIFGNTRALLSLKGRRLFAFLTTVLPNTLTALLITISVDIHGALTVPAFACILGIAVLQLICFVFSLKRDRRTRING